MNFLENKIYFIKSIYISCFTFDQRGKVLGWIGILQETVFLDLFLFFI